VRGALEQGLSVRLVSVRAQAIPPLETRRVQELLNVAAQSTHSVDVAAASHRSTKLCPQQRQCFSPLIGQRKLAAVLCNLHQKCRSKGQWDGLPRVNLHVKHTRVSPQ